MSEQKSVLYRKHRPRSFSEIVGQDQIVKVLRATVLSDTPAHGYLFTGSRGTGKTTVARIFAHALNDPDAKSKKQNGDPNLKSELAEEVRKGSFVDIVEIDAASHRGINEIRDLKEKAAFAPSQGKYKVYIIDEVHMLTKEAFNALLKTLEEPPQQTVFILATTEVHKVPQTILSRVVRFDFKLASQEELKQKLERILKEESVEIEVELLDLIIKQAKGSYRDAESILEKVMQVAEDNKLGFDIGSKALGMQFHGEISELVSNLLEAQASSVYQDLLLKLDEIFTAGANASYVLAELTNIIIERFSDFEKMDGASKKRLFQLAAQVQSIINNLSYYPDPVDAIKLGIINYFGQLQPQQQPAVVPSQPVVVVREQIKSKPVSASVKDSATVAVSEVSIEVGESVSPELKLTFINAIRALDSRLAALLSQVEIKALADSKFLIKVPYKFHVQRLQQIAAKKLLSEAFVKATGIAGVQVIVEEDKDMLKTQSTSTSTDSSKASPGDSNADLVEEVFSDII
jgi:DNA polymerase III subunit gamma/tau